MKTRSFTQSLRRAAMFFAATSVISTGVFAQTPLPNSDASTAAFVALCQNRADVEAQNFCFGFGEGVYQSFVMQRSSSAKPTICVPKGMSRDTVLSEFLVWTQARPKYNGEYAAKTIIRFLNSRYPCAKTP